jgi:uncharacterized protein (TIGR04255 family)
LKLPRKITPDNIREAIVELRYETLLPFNVIPGIVFKIFDNTYTYTDRPISTRPRQKHGAVAKNGELTIRIDNQVLIYNEKIIMYVQPNSFRFTCKNDYIGWQDFRDEIMKAVKLIQNDEIVAHWSRIGVRYISDYPGQDLRDCTKFNFTFGFPETRSETVGLRSEFAYEDSRVILNLSNHVPLQFTNQRGSVETITASVIDIDVIRNIDSSYNMGRVMETMDQVHQQQKKLFFGLLTEDFLKSLQPEY